jgi:hypothetical protein
MTMTMPRANLYGLLPEWVLGVLRSRALVVIPLSVSLEILPES